VCVLRRDENENDNLRFLEIVFEFFFKCLDLNKIDNGNEKTKTLIVKIIKNDRFKDFRI